MNNPFDELSKSLAQSVTRRAALKKFGVGLAGLALTCFGLANRAQAGRCQDKCRKDCKKQFPSAPSGFQICYENCLTAYCFGP